MTRPVVAALAAVLAALLALPLAAQQQQQQPSAPAQPAAPPPQLPPELRDHRAERPYAEAVALARRLPRAGNNDNVRIAGTRRGRTVTVVLEPRLVSWRPSADDSLVFRTYAFAEPGRAAEVPGPLLRARVGDTLRVTVRNPLPRALHVAGLVDRATARERGVALDTTTGMPVDTLHVPAGAERTVTIPLREAGTFWYDAITTHPTDPAPRRSPFPGRQHPFDWTLSGAFVVDERSAARDLHARERILFISSGGDGVVGGTLQRRWGSVSDTRLYVNGGSWPNTERLRYTVGDSVRWRVINAAFLPHPMHLHGFYFRVDARGSAARDTTYAEAERRQAVTELVNGFTTARLAWVPERAGNWLFHCHLALHMAPLKLPPGQKATEPRSASHLAHGGARAPAVHGMAGVPGAGTARGADLHPHLREAMAGLVLGITVREKPGHRPPPEPVVQRLTDPLTLWVTHRDSVHGTEAGYGFVLQQDTTPPARDSIVRPGTPIVLERGMPAEIVVRNTLDRPVAVHWHGMELESRYDGVGAWSGMPGSVTPPIAAGGSFAVRFTPPRAGTFIYHTHDEERNELAAGLFGPLLVVERGETRDVRRDHVLVFGSGVRTPAAPGPPTPTINADTGTTAIALAPGTPHRFRLVNITENDLKTVRLLDAAGTPLSWRIVGKDGWTPPAHQSARLHRAEQVLGVGETYDVEVSAEDAARARTLEVETVYYPGWRKVRTHVARVELGSRE